MSEQTYAITYKIERQDPPLTKPQAKDLAEKEKGTGACDSLVLFSILHADKQTEMLAGSTSMMVVSANGHTGRPLGPIDLFQTWVVFADNLMEQLDPEGPRYKLCEAVLESVREALSDETEDSDGGG